MISLSPNQPLQAAGSFHAKLRAFALIIAPAFLLAGCGTLGKVIKAGGQMTGYSELSDMGESMEKSDREFNEEEKYFVGRTVAATLMADAPLARNAKLAEYVNAVGCTLAMASDKPELFRGYHFAVMDSEQPNAFACPGGLVFISRGLIARCRTEDELAGVLAHEVAHSALEHPMQAVQASHQRAAAASLVKFGIRKAGEQSSDLSELSGLFDNVVKDVAKAVANGYSRDKEQEADRTAVAILARAGYSPLALADLLERMENRSGSHGDPKQRAAAVRQAAQAVTAGPACEARHARFQANAK